MYKKYVRSVFCLALVCACLLVGCADAPPNMQYSANTEQATQSTSINKVPQATTGKPQSTVGKNEGSSSNVYSTPKQAVKAFADAVGKKDFNAINDCILVEIDEGRLSFFFELFPDPDIRLFNDDIYGAVFQNGDAVFVSDTEFVETRNRIVKDYLWAVSAYTEEIYGLKETYRQMLEEDLEVGNGMTIDDFRFMVEKIEAYEKMGTTIHIDDLDWGDITALCKVYVDDEECYRYLLTAQIGNEWRVVFLAGGSLFYYE